MSSLIATLFGALGTIAGCALILDTLSPAARRVRRDRKRRIRLGLVRR